MRTGNPIEDAAAYFHKEPEYTYQHKCVVCKDGFDSGFGIKVEHDETFCDECIESEKHYVYYLADHVSLEEIHQLNYHKL